MIDLAQMMLQLQLATRNGAEVWHNPTQCNKTHMHIYMYRHRDQVRHIRRRVLGQHISLNP